MSDTPAPTQEAQLGWESRFGRLAAGAAFGSAALVLASVIYRAAQIETPDKDHDRKALVLLDEHHTDFFVSIGLQLASFVLLVGALLYLLRATSYRRPETPGFTVGLLALGPVLLAVGVMLNQLSLNDVADQFLSSERMTEKVADTLLKDRDQVGGALQFGGAVCFGLSFVLVSLNAMRAGLLSRFMGFLGILVGALLVVPILPGIVLQLFWLVALGALFLGLWPGGRGPAWESGEAIPWPTPTEIRAEQEAREGLGKTAEGDAAPEPTPRPASRKRKRKRR